MKSRGPHRNAKRRRWKNNPHSLRRRSAANDARREAIAALLPPVDPGPAPLSVWQTVLVLDARGEVMRRIVIYVPAGDGLRCDQHPTEIDGVRSLETATSIGKVVASTIYKRPSLALQASIRREEWAAAAQAYSQA